MSRERDLLERWAYQSGFAEYYTLREETETFLTQPESLREDLREGLREGISLRDHFAGLAMQGIIAFHGCSFLNIGAAYEYADAMLAEREKRDE